MLYLDQSGQEIGQTRECPDCKKSTMALEAVNPAVFLGGTFARCQCRRCRKEIVRFLPSMN
jgi:hypothetical protein